MRFKIRMQYFTTLIISITILLSSCSTDTSKKPDSAKSQEDSGWNDATQDKVTMKNSNVSFEMDTGTSHFIVKNINTGKQYSSIPDAAITSDSETIQNRLESEIVVRYFDENSTEKYMYSTSDAVKNSGLKVKYTDNAIRTYYTLGTPDADLFVPELFLSETYDNEIIGNLKSQSTIRRINLAYTLYSSSNNDEEYKKMLEKYPVLEKQDLYIINENLSSLQKIEIDTIMKDLGYSRKNYEELISKLGMKISILDAPGFIVPVEYKLTDEGFSATILTDKVSEKSTKFKLQKIELLQYFASTGESDKGYYLVPDGSGALIDMNSKKTGAYSQQFYGNDLAISSGKVSQITEDAMLPVFGISQNEGGLFAIVDGAASVATLTVQTRGASSPQNTAYISFAYRTVDIIKNTKLATTTSPSGEYNLYCSAPLVELPSVKYMLLDSEHSDYSGMAAYYRSYLVTKGILSDKTNSSGASMMLDYYCIVTSEETFLGTPYSKKIVLSTLAGIKTKLEQLYQAGVENINIRLNGYSPDGISHGANIDFDIDKRVGSIEQLKELAILVESHGGCLYLEADFQTVFKDSIVDKYSQRKDSAYSLERTLVRRGEFNIVNRENTGSEINRFYVSPSRFGFMSMSFIQSIKKIFSDDFKIGLAYSNAGSALYGDYNSNMNFNRTASLTITVETLRGISENTKNVMIDKGNAYAFPFAGYMSNLVLNSSNFDIESQSVPFYQMVIHGRISYSGVPRNLSEDAQIQNLRAIEYGAGVHYSWINGNNSLLRGTEYETRKYSLYDEDWTQEFIDKYSEIRSYMDSINGVLMIKHEKLSEFINRTTYENGVQVVINYGDSDYTIDGTVIGKKGYHIFSNEGANK